MTQPHTHPAAHPAARADAPEAPQVLKDQADREPIRLTEYWPYQITVLADRIARLTAAIVKREAGLNLSQWRVLAAIAEAPGRTAAEVVTVTPMDKGIVSRATKALLEAGLVVRRASQADGRVSHLYLTGKGMGVYAHLRDAVEAVPIAANRMMDSGEQDAFCSLVRRLANSVPDGER
ncbi:MarR family transcriptional regulator [Maricaulis sp.]|uniref:MarR family winged helix-turn-helix transcriptional regulator n=1 Tax=Maricaulis sp. TaxID=1486257 RepID=UPI0025F9CA0C|nr:MarR family transcriptional regulator [Maricaulis sp.]MDF1770134.1 MarR family transcriptional regulator [Maricaulis sp.]